MGTIEARRIALRAARLASVRTVTAITDDGRDPRSLTATDICNIAELALREVETDDIRRARAILVGT